jgi:hypothetical protein
MDVPWSLGAVAAAVSVLGEDLELLYDPDQNGSDFDDTTDVEIEGVLRHESVLISNDEDSNQPRAIRFDVKRCVKRVCCSVSV